MTTHKITWTRSGSYNGMDWENEHVITYRYTPPQPARRDGPLAGPATDAEVEFLSIEPGAGDHGAYTKMAQQSLESDADDFLQNDGFDEALTIATSDVEAAKDFAADLRADR